MNELRSDAMDREPEHDPRIGALLRQAEGAARGAGPAERARREALEVSVLAAATPALVRLRRTRRPEERSGRWWEWAAGWSPVAVPAGLLAAAAALLLALRHQPTPASAGPVGLSGVLVERSLTDQAVLAALAAPRAEAVDTLVGPATRDWLLAAAMQLESPVHDDSSADDGSSDDGSSDDGSSDDATLLDDTSVPPPVR